MSAERRIRIETVTGTFCGAWPCWRLIPATDRPILRGWRACGVGCGWWADFQFWVRPHLRVRSGVARIRAAVLLPTPSTSGPAVTLASQW